MVIKLIKLSCYKSHLSSRQNEIIKMHVHVVGKGSDGSVTRCGGVGRGSAGRRDGSRARSRLLGLSGACGRAHRGGRGSAPLAGKVGGGVGREGGLSLVAGAPLLPLATAAAAGGAAGADG